jgi:hypothetical protein
VGESELRHVRSAFVTRESLRGGDHHGGQRHPGGPTPASPQIARPLGVSRSTLYKYVPELRESSDARAIKAAGDESGALTAGTI